MNTQKNKNKKGRIAQFTNNNKKFLKAIQPIFVVMGRVTTKYIEISIDI